MGVDGSFEIVVGSSREHLGAKFCELACKFDSGLFEDFEEDVGAVDNKDKATDDIASEKDI